MTNSNECEKIIIVNKSMKIYHYTSIDALAMIMSTRSIKFNRLDKVDDMEERAPVDLI